MELYKQLVPLGCFHKNDLIRFAGSESSAEWYIKSYLQKGYIERVRRDLYTVISLETEQPVASRFQIASKAAEDACIICHSAFEYYGYANQVFYDVYFASEKRVRAFEYDGINYCHLTSPESLPGTEMSDGVCVTSLEQTVVDSIVYMEKIGGLEELLRCLMLVPALNEDKLLAALAAYGKATLYQKAGYILSSLQEELSLDTSFFTECEKHCSASKIYLFPRQRGFVFHEKWKLYAPDDLRTFTDKGMSEHASI